MTIEELYNIITSNKNHKKYNIEQNENGFTVTLGSFRLIINRTIANNIESEIPYIYLDSERTDRVVKVHDIEKDINVLLSRDWEPQIYSRGFHVFIGEPEENGDYEVDKKEFLKYDDYDLIDDVEKDGNYNVTLGLADADIVYVKTISSLPKVTLDSINNIDATKAIYSDASTYSDKYTGWYGRGFSKGKFK